MVEEHDGDVRFYTGSGNTAVSRMRSEKIRNITLIYGRIAENLRDFKGNRGRETRR